MTSRSYLCTDFNFGGDAQGYLEACYNTLKARYLVGQLEKCPSSGNPHVQFYINFEQGTRFGKLKKFSKTMHAEKCDSDAKSINYCKKEETRLEGPWEFGEKAFHRYSSVDWNEAYEHAKNGDFQKLDKKVLIQHYSNLKKLHEDFGKELKVTTLPDQITLPSGFGFIINMESKRRHLWLWSKAPNTGKTTFAKNLEQYGTYWWSYEEKFQDIQKGTQIIVFDEYQTAHLKYSQLNMVCDGTYKYTRKGITTLQIQSPLVIVMGNKDPKEVYPNNFNLIEARFQLIEL